MADKVITVPEPSVSTDGLTLILNRRDGAWTCDVHYDRDGVNYSIRDALKVNDLTLAQRNEVQAAVTTLLNVAKPRMRRSDGGDPAGF